MHELGQGVSRDYQEALSWYRNALAHGNMDAKAGIERTEKKASAREPCSSSPDSGVVPGKCEYEEGEKLYYGRGAAQNYAEAAVWYLKAAKAGHPDAQYSIGFMYEWGRGVSRNCSEALGWYRKAADQGNADAHAAAESLQKKGLCAVRR